MDQQDSIMMACENQAACKITWRAFMDHQRISISSLCSPELSPSEMDAAQSLSEMQTQPLFFSKVSTIPIVHSALQAYEKTKENYGLVRYGATMVESSMKPVIEKIGGGKMEEMVCRYLDRWAQPDQEPEQELEKEQETRSRWHQALTVTGAGMAVISEEGMKNLKICLEWLTVML